MPRIHKQVEIKAPVHAVYEFIEDPKRDTQWMKNMTTVSGVTGTGRGAHFNWTWKMAGLRLKGESNNIEDVPDKKIVVHSSGDIESTWTFNLEPQADKTVLNLDIDYQIPIPVLGKLAEKVVEKRNERDTELALDSLKKLLEK